jgi:hypothetical protein
VESLIRMGNIGMEILKFENAPAPRKSARKNSNIKSLAGLATVAAVAVLGSTLAANITLGSGSLEFGQGVQTTAACDSSITLSPKVTFKNGTDPQFYLSTISFSDVDTRTAGQGSTISGGTGCAGKTLTLNTYGQTSATPVSFATVSNALASQATIGIATNAITTSTGFTIAAVSNTGAALTSFDFGINEPAATSGAVYKITLQSSN